MASLLSAFLRFYLTADWCESDAYIGKNYDVNATWRLSSDNEWALAYSVFYESKQCRGVRDSKGNKDDCDIFQMDWSKGKEVQDVRWLCIISK